MSQTYQTLSKEGGQTKLEQLLLANQAMQFLMATSAQELRELSGELSAPVLELATFQYILQILKSIRTTQVNTKLTTVFTAS